MTFQSILFSNNDGSIKHEEITEPPSFFRDLNLDQLIDTLTVGKQEYNLKPFFYTCLTDIDTIRYRHEIAQDLENPALFEHIKVFAQNMRTMREHLVQATKLYYHYQRESWFLDAVDIYCDAVTGLTQSLSSVDLKARGFLALRD